MTVPWLCSPAETVVVRKSSGADTSDLVALLKRSGRPAWRAAVGSGHAPMDEVGSNFVAAVDGFAPGARRVMVFDARSGARLWQISADRFQEIGGLGPIAHGLVTVRADGTFWAFDGRTGAVVEHGPDSFRLAVDPGSGMMVGWTAPTA